MSNIYAVGWRGVNIQAMSVRSIHGIHRFCATEKCRIEFWF